MTAALTSEGVQPDGQAADGRGVQRQAGGLRGAHHGADVRLREHPLDGHRIGVVLVDLGRDAVGDAEQPLLERHVRRGAHDRHVDESCAPVRCDLDDADAAPGEPGVHPEHTEHGYSPSSSSSSACTSAGMSKFE